MIQPSELQQADLEEFEQQRAKFYEIIGHCITEYQKIEDYLPDVFEAAIGLNKERAKKIFDVARGLEAKLDIISGALFGCTEDSVKCWAKLLKRVAEAAKARNEMAHAEPVHNGGMTTITIDEVTREAVRIERNEGARMELRKRNKSGQSIWTIAQMQAEYHKSKKLFGNLIAFVKLLQNEAPPDHLLDGLWT